MIEKYEDPAGDGNIKEIRARDSNTIEKYEDPAGDGNGIAVLLCGCNFRIEKYEDPAGDGNITVYLLILILLLRNTKTPQGTETGAGLQMFQKAH